MINVKFLKKLFNTQSLSSEIEEGGNIWNELDTVLPQAVGVLEDDEPRLEAFAQKVKKLSRKKKKLLKNWLKAQIYDLETNFSELSTATEEELERKWIQIYRTHLEVIH